MISRCAASSLLRCRAKGIQLLSECPSPQFGARYERSLSGTCNSGCSSRWFSHVTHAAVPSRAFERCGSEVDDESKQHRFRAVSYNILANPYAYEPAHSHCPRQFLDWENRKPRILTELNGYDADIICLQEVEKNVFLDDLEEQYLAKGYEGLFCEKTPLVPQDFQEGVALFYNTSLFTRLASQSARFSDEFQKTGTGQYFKAVRTKGDSFVMALLEHKPSGRYVLVCNVHLYWNPKWPDVKLSQMHVLLRCISTFKARQNLKKPIACVVMGDFNSISEKVEVDRFDKIMGRKLSSGVHHLLTNGSVDQTHPHHPFKRNHTGRISKGRIRMREVRFDADFQFESAYVLGTGKEPLVTNCTSDFKNCIDFIFLSKGDFHALETLSMPYESEGLREAKHVKFHRIPNAVFPSDHLAIGATLSFKPL